MKIKDSDLRQIGIEEKIAKKESFLLTEVGSMSETADYLKAIVKKNGMRCRVYTKGRIASAGASLFGGPALAVGIAAMAGMAAHNLVTFNPDYEIKKDYLKNTVAVSYQKNGTNSH